MTRTERTARLLASELSPNGEASWTDYVGLAEQVGDRLDSDFHRLFGSSGTVGNGRISPVRELDDMEMRS